MPYKTMSNVLRDLRKATRLTPKEYGDGPVFWDGGPTGNDNGFFMGGVDGLLELAKSAEVDHPAWVWASKEPHSIELDAFSIIENAAEDIYEEAVEQIPSDAIEDLKAMLRTWCKREDVKNATRSWHEDRSRVVVLDAARFEAEIA